MKRELDYIEQNLKIISTRYPGYFDHILTEQELYEYIMMLIEQYSSDVDKKKVIESTGKTAMLSEYFSRVQNQIVFSQPKQNRLDFMQQLYRNQTEEKYIQNDYDISYSRILRWLPAQWHTDNFFQIYYTSEDTCPIYFQNERFDLKKGFLMIIAPGTCHATPCYGDDAVLEHFFLRASTFDQVFFRLLSNSTILSHFFRKALDFESSQTAYLAFDTGCDPDIEHIVHTMINEAIAPLPYGPQMMNTLMAQMFILLLRKYEQTARLPAIDNFRWKHEFSEILFYIQNHFSEASQKEISEKFCYSERQINRIIHSCMNMSYSELITFLRMQKAAEMLKQRTYPLDYISLTLGYNNTSSFLRAFKKYYRLTPAQYLNQTAV